METACGCQGADGVSLRPERIDRRAKLSRESAPRRCRAKAQYGLTRPPVVAAVARATHVMLIPSSVSANGSRAPTILFRLNLYARTERIIHTRVYVYKITILSRVPTGFV